MPDMIRFGELLEKMHEVFDGFEVATDIVQIASEDNGGLFIHKAVVKVWKGDKSFTYSGYGDAAKWNVGKAIVPSICRMSETRAIVRAFKLATNVGTVSVEEMPQTEAGEEDQTPEPPPDMKGAAKNVKGEVAEPDDPVTDGQKKYLATLIERMELAPEDVEKEYGIFETMTAKKASEVIESLNKVRREQTG